MMLNNDTDSDRDKTYKVVNHSFRERFLRSIVTKDIQDLTPS